MKALQVILIIMFLLKLAGSWNISLAQSYRDAYSIPRSFACPHRVSCVYALNKSLTIGLAPYTIPPELGLAGAKSATVFNDFTQTSQGNPVLVLVVKDAWCKRP